MKYKIGIWGQYGAPGQKIADGQAVRTTVVTRELENRYGKNNIGIANTNGWKKRPFAFLLESFRLIADSDVVIIAPADRGYKTFVPILMFFNRFYHRKLVHLVIGGFLPTLLEQNPQYCGYEKKFDSIFVQTENIKKDLEKLGINNIHYLTNLKRLKKRNVDDIKLETNDDIKVCVFSRINKDKGVEDAIAAVKIVNERLGAQRVTLDFYGLLPGSYKDRFNQLLEENKGLIEYKGIVDYNTTYTKDVIKNGRNGILVPIQDPNAIADALQYLYEHREIRYEYAKNCLEDADQYKPDKVMAEFYQTMEEYWK